MSVTVASIPFEHHECDERGDVLYLSVAGCPGSPARAYASPEGHNVEYDDSGRAIAMTLVNVRRLLDRDGELTITWPVGHVQADELAELRGELIARARERPAVELADRDAYARADLAALQPAWHVRDPDARRDRHLFTRRSKPHQDAGHRKRQSSDASDRCERKHWRGELVERGPAGDRRWHARERASSRSRICDSPACGPCRQYDRRASSSIALARRPAERGAARTAYVQTAAVHSPRGLICQT